jgi:hypothetical protein
VPLDNEVYDVPRLLKDNGVDPTSLRVFKPVFGETKELHQDLSPATHIAKARNIPPFLIVVATQPESDNPDEKAGGLNSLEWIAVKKLQAQWFADKLKGAGVSAKIVLAEGKKHRPVNDDLGLPDDKPTQALFEFLDGVLKK